MDFLGRKPQPHPDRPPKYRVFTPVETTWHGRKTRVLRSGWYQYEKMYKYLVEDVETGQQSWWPESMMHELLGGR